MVRHACNQQTNTTHAQHIIIEYKEQQYTLKQEGNENSNNSDLEAQAQRKKTPISRRRGRGRRWTMSMNTISFDELRRAKVVAVEKAAEEQVER